MVYLTSKYPGIDPYQVCHKHVISKQKTASIASLKQLCTEELSKKLSSNDTDKLLVQKDKTDKRNLDMEKFLCVLDLKRKIAIVTPKLDKDLINLWTKKVPLWQELDPYSGLEYKMSTSPSSNDTSVTTTSASPSKESANQGTFITRIGRHILLGSSMTGLIMKWRRGYQVQLRL